MTQKQNNTLDIFRLLAHIGAKDGSYYDKLTTEEIKQLQPFVVMRWLTGTTDVQQVYFINELVNSRVFSLTQHKHLLYMLMCCAASGNTKRYQWKKPASKRGASAPIAISVIQRHYGYNTRDARDVLTLHDNSTILQMAEDLGLQKEDIAKLNKELKELRTKSGKV